MLTELEDCTDDCISKWTCGGGEYITTMWSKCGPSERGLCLIHIFLCVITTLTVLGTKQQPPHSYLTLFLPLLFKEIHVQFISFYVQIDLQF